MSQPMIHLISRVPIVVLLVLLIEPGWTQDPAQPLEEAPDESRYVYRSIPDAALTLASGEQRRLAELWEDRPLLLTFIFSRCAGICSPFLRNLKATVNGLGDSDLEYDIVVLSFDPRDSAETMKQLAEHLDLETDARWIFAVAAPGDIRRLTDSIGFWYRWDENVKQFNHPSMIAAIKSGKCVRLYTGGVVPKARMEEILAELRGDFVSIYPLPGKVLFRCFDYSPDEGFAPNWGMLIMVAPAVIALVLTLGVFAVTRRVTVEPS